MGVFCTTLAIAATQGIQKPILTVWTDEKELPNVIFCASKLLHEQSDQIELTQRLCYESCYRTPFKR
jgi:hypothetical protein